MPDLTPLQQLVNDVGKDTAQQLLDLFKNGTLEHLQAIQDYSQNGGELSELRRHAHSLKGLCQTYGAMNGGDAAEALQAACDTGDAAQIQTCVDAVLTIIPKEIESTLTAFQSL